MAVAKVEASALAVTALVSCENGDPDDLLGRPLSGDPLYGWPFLQEYGAPLYGRSSITSFLLT